MRQISVKSIKSPFKTEYYCIPLLFFFPLSLLLSRTISPVKPVKLKNKASLCICALFCTVLLVFSSCSKVCQTGYANPNCSTEIRAQFENLYYTVTESKNQDSAYTYSATIIASPSGVLKVLMTNVGNGAFVNNVVAVANADTLTIPYQAPDSNAHYIVGGGIISGNVLLLTYTITYPDSVPTPHTQTDSYQSQWVHP